VLALAGIYAAAGSGHQPAAASQPGQAGQATVSTAVRACPAPGSSSPTSASLAVTAMSGAATSGTATVTGLTPGGSTSAGPVIATVGKPGVLVVSGVKTAAPLTKAEQTAQPGSSSSVSTEDGRGGVEVTATGAMAQGLEVEQTGSAGLATLTCSAPGTSFWFVGPGQALAGHLDLYLLNTGDEPADAQLSALTDVSKGPPLLGNADNGISVPPHSMVTQSLGALVQSSKVVALNITTSVGQIVAAVRETRSSGDDGAWLTPVQAPARHLVIPGLPNESGTPELYIAVPGSGSAAVKITAVTSRGSYQPTGGTGIELLGSSAATIALPSLSGIPGAVVISSSVPVVAAMLVSGGPSGTPGAVAVSAGPVAEQGVLADNPAHSAGSTSLVLSAPGKAATVRITTATTSTSASGQAGQTVSISAGNSVVVHVTPPPGTKASQFAIVITPSSGSGPVYAARIASTGGNVQSIMPVPSSLTWIPIPAAQDSLSDIMH
jgi:Family of unknown function (DUF5719)